MTDTAPTDPDSPLQQEIQRLRDARAQGPVATFLTCAKLSGPGWLQSAITLGGGSLASSLYLGVLGGFALLWLQPLAMILGIVMLSAIGYVTLSTGRRPFEAINADVNPVLGWGWALASLAASMVWSLPQFSLATGVLQQNLLPGLLGSDGPLGATGSKLLIVLALAAVAVFVTWRYDEGSRGVKLYERLLKLLVGLIVLCFFGVVARLTFSEQGLAWGEVFAGFVPDLDLLSAPAQTFAPFLNELSAEANQFWTNRIVDEQRDVMISAAATAVGINMTFLLPYSMLRRGWGRDHRGLARVDLGIGMLIPFLLATSCVVIAAANRFHTEPVPGLLATEASATADVSGGTLKSFHGLCDARLASQLDAEAMATLKKDADALAAARLDLPQEEREVAAMLAKRDAFDLAKALEPFTGDLFANILFGLGVLGMALSTITLLMLISGFVCCEVLGLPQGGKAHRLGCLTALTGILGPFVPGDSFFYLAVPTSVFGMMLLPIAYWTFFLMMNSRKLLGDDLPRGGARVAWNGMMLFAAGLATAASLYSIQAKTGVWGFAALGAFLALAVVVGLKRRS